MSDNIQSIYEKMSSNPDFNKKVLIEQPTPYNEDPITENKPKSVARPPTSQPLNELLIINKRIDNLEKALQAIMKTHTKLLSRL